MLIDNPSRSWSTHRERQRLWKAHPLVFLSPFLPLFPAAGCRQRCRVWTLSCVVQRTYLAKPGETMNLELSTMRLVDVTVGVKSASLIAFRFPPRWDHQSGPLPRIVHCACQYRTSHWFATISREISTQRRRTTPPSRLAPSSRSPPLTAPLSHPPPSLFIVTRKERRESRLSPSS